MRLLAGVSSLLFLLFVGGCQSLTLNGQDFQQVMAQGEVVYRLNCQRCHHPQGQGYRHLFPNLSGSQMVTLHDPIPIIQIVKHGRGAMPSFDQALTDDEIAAVLTYIRNSWLNKAAPVNPQDVSD